jgi:hypothetical protein
LVQAFLKKWWVESDLKAPNLPLSLRLKGNWLEYPFELEVKDQGQIILVLDSLMIEII